MLGRRFAAIAFLSAALACQKGDNVVTRTVNLHLAASCEIPANSFGTYTATGDFPFDPNVHAPLVFLDQAGAPLDGIPANVQSLALGAFAPDQAPWNAVTLVAPTGDIDMLLLPRASACALATNVGVPSDMIMGALDPHRVLTLGSPAFRVELDTGHVARLVTGPTTARIRAPLVATGDGGAIIPGGLTASTPTTLQSIEVYDPTLGDFVSPIDTTFHLTAPRADHGGVLLPSGKIWIAGGQWNGTPIAQTEIIDVRARTVTPGVSLTIPRTKPYVLRLASGTLLVGGGFDQNGAPVGTVEFYSPDASTLLDSTPVPARALHAFVALDGGGALFVTVPDVADPPDFANTWMISADRVAVSIPKVSQVTDAKLFAGAGGHPLWWTGNRWLAFAPWDPSGWAPFDVSTGVIGPATSSPITTVDPGLVSWVDDTGRVLLRRHSVRNAFATDIVPFLTNGSITQDLLVPDRWPADMTFDDTQGLALGAGETAFVSDARFLDVTVDVDAPADGVPHVVLRGEQGNVVDVGGANCPFLQLVPPAHLQVVRQGTFVTFTLTQGVKQIPGACGNASIGPTERVAVGVRGGPARAKSLQITR